MKRIFYDTSCPLTKRIMNTIKKLDKGNRYTISSLDGKKAKTLFQGNYSFLRDKKSKVIFLENKRVWMKTNAVLRIYWLLGGWRKALGAFFWMPGFIINPIYRLCRLFVRK